MLWGMFLFFLHKTIITRSLSRKSRQGVETGQNHPEMQQFLNFAFCRTIYRPEILLRLQGFPEANFNPKTYRKQALSSCEAQAIKSLHFPMRKKQEEL